jgi:hypothetical protein
LHTPHTNGPHGDPTTYDMIEQNTIFTNIGVVTFNDVKVGFNSTNSSPVFAYGDLENYIDQIVVDRFSFTNPVTGKTDMNVFVALLLTKP